MEISHCIKKQWGAYIINVWGYMVLFPKFLNKKSKKIKKVNKTEGSQCVKSPYLFHSCIIAWGRLNADFLSVTVLICYAVPVGINASKKFVINYIYIECSSLGPSSGGALLQSLSSCDKEQLPPLIFNPPEYFVKKVKKDILQMKSVVKMLVLDEVHKIFDRSFKFRACYDSFKTLKDDFSGIPIMALTATITDSQLENLAKNYPRSPVLIRGSVNKKNTKLNIEQYQTVHRRERDDMWDGVAKTLVDTIRDDYAIVYMDF